MSASSSIFTVILNTLNSAFLVFQASGTVRFYHRKHQCYIVGEGSYVGHHGYLPDASDSNDDSMAASIQNSTLNRDRKKSPVPPASFTRQKFEVKADVEAIPGELVSTPPSAMSFIMDLESQEQSILFSDDGSASLSHVKSRTHSWQSSHGSGLRKPSRPLNSWESSVDEVVSEDGKD